MGMSLILLVALGVSGECKEGLRDDPVALIRADKTHYVYFLPDELNRCQRLTKDFTDGLMNALCGCKHIKVWVNKDLKDVVRLRCVYRINDRYVSQTVAHYYYYPESAPACNKLAVKLMRDFK